MVPTVSRSVRSTDYVHSLYGHPDSVALLETASLSSTFNLVTSLQKFNKSNKRYHQKQEPLLDLNILQILVCSR